MNIQFPTPTMSSSHLPTPPAEQNIQTSQARQGLPIEPLVQMSNHMNPIMGRVRSIPTPQTQPREIEFGANDNQQPPNHVNPSMLQTQNTQTTQPRPTLPIESSNNLAPSQINPITLRSRNIQPLQPQSQPIESSIPLRFPILSSLARSGPITRTWSSTSYRYTIDAAPIHRVQFTISDIYNGDLIEIPAGAYVKVLEKDYEIIAYG